MGTVRGRLAALPVLAALIVAVAAGAAVRGSSGPASTEHQASVDVASVVLTLLGVVLVGATAFMAYALLSGDRGRAGERAGEEGPSLRYQLLVSALVLAVVAGAGTVTWLLLHHQTRGHGSPAGGQSTTVPHLPHVTPLAYSDAAGGWTLAVVGVVVGALLLRRGLRRWHLRRDATFLDLVAGDLAAPAPTAAGLLVPLAGVAVPDPQAEPDPRRAVIAAWLAMAEAIGGAWRARADSEAPFEYLQEALTGAGVRADSAGRLTTLFEVARWSGRPVGEEMRAEAIAALDAVRHDLAAAA